jgi:hypothetical protein
MLGHRQQGGSNPLPSIFPLDIKSASTTELASKRESHLVNARALTTTLPPNPSATQSAKASAFDTSCFHARQKAHRLQVQEIHLAEVQHHRRRPGVFRLRLQLGKMSCLDSAADPKDRVLSVERLFNSQHLSAGFKNATLWRCDA